MIRAKIYIIKKNTAAIDTIDTTDHIKDCGLACAVWANEGSNFAFFCGERAVFYSVETAKRFIDVMDGQHNIKKGSVCSFCVY